MRRESADPNSYAHDDLMRNRVRRSVGSDIAQTAVGLTAPRRVFNRVGLRMGTDHLGHSSSIHITEIRRIEISLLYSRRQRKATGKEGRRKRRRIWWPISLVADRVSRRASTKLRPRWAPPTRDRDCRHKCEKEKNEPESLIYDPAAAERPGIRQSALCSTSHY